MGTTIKMRIQVGNTANKVSDERWDWRMFTTVDQNEAKHIAKVVYKLHPTFRTPVVELTEHVNGKWQTARHSGWGTFDVGVELHWAAPNQAPLCFNHQLSFAEGGASAAIDIEMPPAHTNEVCEAEEPEDPAPVPEEPLPLRKDVLKMVSRTGFLEHDDSRFWHGRAFAGEASPPECTWRSRETPRDDHDAPEWLTASEFTDSEAVIAAKVKQLAQLMRLSKKTVVYSGAGISVAACIGQAAAGSSGAGSKSTDALPTFTHYALGALSKAGLLHGWVQQNHDGLPQKAGFPQEHINEIHGSWYDPSNPVVKYSGTLKGEQFPWMVNDAETADLVLVLGTSLGGLNADQVAIKPAKRSLKKGALGTVMINLQQTEQDGKASLRIFGQSDEVLKRLLTELGISPRKINLKPSTFTLKTPRVLVPYDRHGRQSETAKMWLDPRDGATVKLTDGHNVQGAQQPAYMHIGADKPYKGRKNGPGHGRVMRRCDNTVSYQLQIEGVRM